MTWQTWLGIGAIAGLAYLLLKGKGEGGDGGFGGAFPLKTEQLGYPYSSGFPVTKKDYAAIDRGSPRSSGSIFGTSPALLSVIQTIPQNIPSIVNKPGEVFGAGISIPSYRPQQQKGYTKKQVFGGGGVGAR